MKTLSQASEEALKRMQSTLTDQATQASTPSHGSISGAGKTITAEPAQGLVPAAAQRQTAQGLPCSNPPQTLALRESQDAKRALTNLLFQCYDALRVYGKEPEQLDNLNKMFHFVLADYSQEQIEKAFVYYLRHNSEMPAPADIAQIIERGGDKPPYDKSVYVTISKKHPADRSSDEWQYMKGYENYILRG